MTNFETEVRGKITAIEFVVEVMLANELAGLSREVSQKFKTDLIDRPGYLSRGPVDADILVSIEAASSASLRNLVEKVSERENDIRAQLNKN